MSNIIRGLQWIYDDRPSRVFSGSTTGQLAPAIANMSWTVDVSNVSCPSTDPSCLNTMETWINKLVDERNITVIAAAGNGNTSASGFSPARLARGNGGKVITVGGTTRLDRRWVCNTGNSWETQPVLQEQSDGSFVWIDVCPAAGSNYGAAIDIFAPSQNVAAATIVETYTDQWGGTTCCTASDTAERQMMRSGTSFAAPLVAGTAARLLQGSSYSRTPLQVWETMKADATVPSTDPPVMNENYSTDSGALFGSPNRLVYKEGFSICRR